MGRIAVRSDRLWIAALLTLLASFFSFVDSTAPALANSISITQTANLLFGSFAAGTTNGTVIIYTDGNPRDITGGVMPIGSSSHPASFNVVCSGSCSSYTIDKLPGLYNLSGAGSQMEIIYSLNKAGGSLLSGSDTFMVGGTLKVNAGQATGSYANEISNSITVTVTYP